MNLDATKDFFFNPEKIISGLILLGTPAACTLSLPMARNSPRNRWLVIEEVKERNCSRNSSSTICEVITDIRAMYRRRGGGKRSTSKIQMMKLNICEQANTRITRLEIEQIVF